MKTVLTIKIELADNDFDRLERLALQAKKWSLTLLEDTLTESLFHELGIFGKITVTKIE